MNHIWKISDLKLVAGAVIKGKWNHRSYQIMKELGSGANGIVYLAEYQSKSVAIKFSDNSSTIATEVNVLKKCQKVQGNLLGPSLLDVDDWTSPKGDIVPFYVMEYVKGIQLPRYIQMNGSKALGEIMIQLLEGLHVLHQSGFIFGDLKPEHLLIVSTPPRLRWIDLGGTTPIGKSLREYTAFYDRGYWKLGSRRADPQYDLFAAAMVMIGTYYTRQFDRGTNPQNTLLNRVKMSKSLRPFEKAIQKALLGKYQSTLEMKKDIEIATMRLTQQKQKPYPTGTATVRTHQKAISRDNYFGEPIGIGVVLLFLYAFFLTFQWVG
ncbi:protein kinase [Bacillaceae bacterium S4-13-58]